MLISKDLVQFFDLIVQNLRPTKLSDKEVAKGPVQDKWDRSPIVIKTKLLELTTASNSTLCTWTYSESSDSPWLWRGSLISLGMRWSSRNSVGFSFRFVAGCSQFIWPLGIKVGGKKSLLGLKRLNQKYSNVDLTKDLNGVWTLFLIFPQSY